MSPCQVRAATPEDAVAAVEVLRDSITQLCVPDHQGNTFALESWLSNKTPQYFCGWLSSPDRYIVVGEVAGQVSGVGSMQRSGEIQLCYVKPGSQRTGVGRALLEALEAQARRWEIRRLRLLSSVVARPFYEAQGFVSSGEPQPRWGGLAQAYPYAKQLDR